MTTSTSNARAFSPIFNADITPASVSTRTGTKVKYAVLSGATVVRSNGKIETGTVMAFGNQRDAVSSLLKKGRKVTLAVQFAGAVLKVIGLPRDKAANEG